MKKMIMVMAGVLVSAFAWAGGLKSESGMAVVKSNASSYKLIYKAELASNVKVEIINADNKVVFSEIIKNSDGFARPYNFGSLPEGDYTIRLDNGSNWLSEKVSYRQGEVQKLAHLVTLKDGRYLLTVPGLGDRQHRRPCRLDSQQHHRPVAVDGYRLVRRRSGGTDRGRCLASGHWSLFRGNPCPALPRRALPRQALPGRLTVFQKWSVGPHAWPSPA
jgi:hypothetical protein